MVSGIVAARWTLGTVGIAVLAVVQAIAVLAWATQWVQMGRDLMGRGILLLPLMTVVAFTRGGFALLTAVLYLLFAWTALTSRRSAWRLGMLAVLLDGLGIFVLIASGESLRQVAMRTVVAIVVLGYLIAPAGRRALGQRGPIR